jgi:hypothetical protein
MPTDDIDNEDLNDTPEMRRLLETVSNLSPEKRQRLWKLIEDALNEPPPPSEDEEPE